MQIIAVDNQDEEIDTPRLHKDGFCSEIINNSQTDKTLKMTI